MDTSYTTMYIQIDAIVYSALPSYTRLVPGCPSCMQSPFISLLPLGKGTLEPVQIPIHTCVFSWGLSGLLSAQQISFIALPFTDRPDPQMALFISA